jgi:hypothetical protein
VLALDAEPKATAIRPQFFKADGAELRKTHAKIAKPPGHELIVKIDLSEQLGLVGPGDQTVR